jgi:hypothetical protein
MAKHSQYSKLPGCPVLKSIEVIQILNEWDLELVPYASSDSGQFYGGCSWRGV